MTRPRSASGEPRFVFGERVCDHCGAAFEARAWNTVHCSAKCATAVWNSRRRAAALRVRPVRVCRLCGGEVDKASPSNAVYCTRKCQRLAAQRSLSNRAAEKVRKKRWYVESCGRETLRRYAQEHRGRLNQLISRGRVLRVEFGIADVRFSELPLELQQAIDEVIEARRVVWAVEKEMRVRRGR